MTASGHGKTGSGRDYSFRNLLAWQKAQELLVEVMDTVRTVADDRVSRVLVQQILRSASAIGANIAEGHWRYSAGAYRNHLSIARGSTTETMSWLDALRRGDYITAERESELIAKCEEIMSLLSSKMIQLDRQTRTDRSLRDAVEDYIVD